MGKQSMNGGVSCEDGLRFENGLSCEDGVSCEDRQEEEEEEEEEEQEQEEEEEEEEEEEGGSASLSHPFCCRSPSVPLNTTFSALRRSVTSPEKCQSRAEISGEKLGWFYTCLSRGQVDLRVGRVATYLGQLPPVVFPGGDFFGCEDRGESISPREFCGSRAVWLGDSHKHSNCGEKAEAADGRVLHQSAHGRSEWWRVLGRAGGAATQPPSDAPQTWSATEAPGEAGGASVGRQSCSNISGRGGRVSALAA
ncbi:hypothetical protein Pcinc_044241 [Petrolisthes cinctipes]|uniref:Uncharacterized protein n=1 Tax=Petrolisthes cinctipes TaxID=88211 RepID=A0AAE1BH79_PETCI|nr:hypothetical protein Pcinc_044241 [Petrolisthes cinctipes]